MLATVYGTSTLVWTVVGGGIIGMVYSMPIANLTRWKRFPLLAASCIFVVRGLIVQIGFHEHLRSALPERSIPPWHESTVTLFAACFFTLIGVGIALFKDVPDILGDEAAGVRTLAVEVGAQRVVNITAANFAVTYAASVVYWVSKGSLPLAVTHAVVGAVLVSKVGNTNVEGPTAAADIRKSYMSIWKFFYLEYLILLLAVII